MEGWYDDGGWDIVAQASVLLPAGTTVVEAELTGALLATERAVEIASMFC